MEMPSTEDERPPCSECPLERLREYLESPLGQLILVIVDLDFAIQKQMLPWFRPANYLEFLLLRLLVEERDRYEAEKMKNPPNGK